MKFHSISSIVCAASILVITLGLGGRPSLACEKYKACGDIHYCAFENLTPQNAWREALVRALQDDDQTGILADTNACQSAVGTPNEWDTHKQSCDLQEIGRAARASRCADFLSPPPPPPGRRWYCYTEGKYYELEHLGPPGTGICQGPHTVGEYCQCGTGSNSSAPGTVQSPNG